VPVLAIIMQPFMPLVLPGDGRHAAKAGILLASGPSGTTMKFATKTIHSGYDSSQHSKSVMPPIYQTSVFEFAEVGEQLPFSYARTGTPTRAALETCLASLENAKHGLAFASGMAAIDAVLRATLKPGDEVIAVADLYGGAYRLLTKVMEPAGITVTFV
jgi:cystathionine beta-lyase/cystathionine gamma-synthase